VIYLDTNILIYASVNQTIEKMEKSQNLILEAIAENNLIISPLVIQEYVFTLNKLKINSALIYNKSIVFEKYCRHYIDSGIISDATSLASQIDFFGNINDIVHLKYAENYCSKLVTYDADFNKLKPYSKIGIEILS
jgi:predicted nucleic acid-binding protein